MFAPARWQIEGRPEAHDTAGVQQHERQDGSQTEGTALALRHQSDGQPAGSQMVGGMNYL